MSAEPDDAVGAPALDRGAVWQRLGAPDEQAGSVNDPRTQQEHGLVWNEKWIYLDPESGRTTRVVLWDRYDLLGIFAISEDGSVARETLEA